MRYLHFYPTCPSCHEPHFYGFPLHIRDEKRRECSGCGCKFHYKLNLIESGFEKIVEKVRTAGIDNAREILSKICLFWEITPNIIEDEYIKWLKEEDPSGNFLITWPWRSVKFSPLLVLEYLLSHQNKKAVIIDDIVYSHHNEPLDFQPDVRSIFGKFVYTEDVIDMDEVERELKTEMNRFGQKNVIEKKELVECEIRRVGTGFMSTETSDQNIEKFILKKLNDLGDIYGGDCVRYLKVDDREKKRYVLNEDGFIDLNFQNTVRFTGNFRYHNDWLWKTLLELDKIKIPSKNISLKTIDKPENHRTENNINLYLIPSDADPEHAFGFIDRVSPDLVVILNADDFIRDKILYRGKKSKSLINFLKLNERSCVLMFSTGRDFRHIYDINGENISDVCDIIPHTWDNGPVVEYILNKVHDNSSSYANPLSSIWEELPSDGNLPEVEYVNVDILDHLDRVLDEALTLKSEPLKKDMKTFVRELKRSPLHLRGNPGRPEVFSRRGVSIESISYTRMISLLQDRLEVEKIRNMEKIFNDLYGYESEHITNPLMKNLCEIASKMLEKKGSFVTLIVHGYDIKGMNKLIEEEPTLAEYMPWKLSVCSWRDLKRRELEIPENNKHYVISTLPPNMDYSIYFSQVDCFTFIGAGENIQKIEKIVENRLTELKTRPLYKLSESEPAPKLLKKIMKEMDIPSNRDLMDLSEDVVFRSTSSFTFVDGVEAEHRTVQHSRIGQGEDAILVLDNEGRGMFIPEGTTVTVKENHGLAEIKLKEKTAKRLENKLKGTEIFVDTGGLHRSFKSIFVKNMMEYGSNVTFQKGPYEWKGFQELYQSAIEWIFVLRKALIQHIQETGKNYKKSENEFSEYLSSLDLNAEDPEYIKGWWSDYELVETESGLYPVYKVEHPKSIEDLRKIYGGITELIFGMDLKIEDAEKSYTASILLQSFRRSFLRGEKMDPKFNQIYRQIKKNIRNIVEESPVFRVSTVYIVKLGCEVERFRIMNDYEQYLRVT